MSNLIGYIGVTIGFILAVFAGGALMVAAFKIAGNDRQTGWLNFVFVVGGGLFGWTGGIFLTPIPGSSEEPKFSNLAVSFLALVTGSVGTKVIEALQNKISKGLDRSFAGTSIVFLSSVLLGGLLTFIWRSYVKI